MGEVHQALQSTSCHSGTAQRSPTDVPHEATLFALNRSSAKIVASATISRFLSGTLEGVIKEPLVEATNSGRYHRRLDGSEEAEGRYIGRSPTRRQLARTTTLGLRQSPSNIMLLVQRQTTDGTVDAMTAANDDGSQLRDEIAATANSSIPYDSVRSGEGACRPLSFPAPVIDGAVSVSADVVDHSTGDSVRYLLGRHELHTRSRDLPFSLSANPGTR